LRNRAFIYLHFVLLIAFVVLSACTSSELTTTVSPPTQTAIPSTTPIPEVSEPTAEQDGSASATPLQPTMVASPTASVQDCAPTEADALGPFYTPGAPQRTAVGQGYILQGVVRSAIDCKPIPNAQIEVWMAGPDGEYRDDYRATFFSDENGAYSFESHFPPPYSGRPPHHHLLVTVAGYQILVTQHYPVQGENQATFDLVLLPNP
jgi:protocatechuate 3,4-dioxygenase beta subunit